MKIQPDKKLSMNDLEMNSKELCFVSNDNELFTFLCVPIKIYINLLELLSYI